MTGEISGEARRRRRACAQPLQPSARAANRRPPKGAADAGRRTDEGTGPARRGHRVPRAGVRAEARQRGAHIDGIARSSSTVSKLTHFERDCASTVVISDSDDDEPRKGESAIESCEQNNKRRVNGKRKHAGAPAACGGRNTCEQNTKRRVNGKRKQAGVPRANEDAAASKSAPEEETVQSVQCSIIGRTEETGPFSPYPSTPQDPRLTASGAILVKEGPEEGRLNDRAYSAFIEYFASASTSVQHPHEFSPGLGAGEIQIEGLKVWHDKHFQTDLKKGLTKGGNGAGWIAVSPLRVEGQARREEKWFNIQTWGSWRYAFVLARLQRKVWEALAGITPWDYDADDNMIEIDGQLMTPAAVRQAAHIAAQSLGSGNVLALPA